MIRVDRAAVPVPADLDGDDSAGGKELKKVLDFYAKPANREAAFEKYEAYKSESVLSALRRLFHGKCAYCESWYKATQPVDVEHFRPKGGVAVVDAATGRPKLLKPGYYWLAARWDNLLPSCIDCNRERTQELEGEDPVKTGKANKFPLASKRRAARPGEETREKPLLLDPCNDDPDQHLEFLPEGVVRPALDGRSRPSRKGGASIEVYGLQRLGLVQLRRDRAIEVKAQIRRVQDLEDWVDRYPDDPKFLDRLAEEIAILKGYMEPDRPYAGMARQLIRALYRRR